MAIYKDVEPLEVVMYKSKGKEFDEGVNFILEKLDAMPVADVVPVVRCKDCKHYDVYHLECHNPHHNGIINCEGFCSYGERKDSND